MKNGGSLMTKKKDPKDYLKVGRPTVMTDEVVRKLEWAFSIGCSDAEACFFAGISKQTLYDYQERNPEYVDRKALLKEKMVLKARTVIANALNNEDKDMARWFLERKRKQEFSTRVESTGADGEPLSLPVLNIVPVRVKDGGQS
jgi:hypothetical protein